jgi:hypothetical protein
MCDNMAAVTEEQAKDFFHREPDPEVPASLKVREDRPPAVYAVKVRGEVVNCSVQFYFYTDAQVDQRAATKYRCKHCKRVTAWIFATQTEADSSK